MASYEESESHITLSNTIKKNPAQLINSKRTK
jgi:hypothetical protein